MSADPPSRRDFLTLGSAGNAASDPSETAADGPTFSSLAAADSTRSLHHHFSTRAMGCQVEIFLNGWRDHHGPDVALQAFAEIQRLEELISTYRAQSLLNTVNASGGRRWVPITRELFELIELALRIHRETSGAFDITSGPLSKTWGFYQRRPRVPSRLEIDQALARVGSDKIELDRAECAVRLGHPEMELNMASIGKGFALDSCRRCFQRSGVNDYLIHAGQSSVVASGHSNDLPEGWRVGVAHPILPDRRLGILTLRNESLATSGSQRQSLVHRGQRLGHVIDPRSGWPTFQNLSATVIAPSAAITDALATAFCVLTIKEIEAYCRDKPEICAIISTRDDREQAQVQVHKINLGDRPWEAAED